MRYIRYHAIWKKQQLEHEFFKDLKRHSFFALVQFLHPLKTPSRVFFPNCTRIHAIIYAWAEDEHGFFTFISRLYHLCPLFVQMNRSLFLVFISRLLSEIVLSSVGKASYHAGNHFAFFRSNSTTSAQNDQYLREYTHSPTVRMPIVHFNFINAKILHMKLSVYMWVSAFHKRNRDFHK